MTQYQLKAISYSPNLQNGQRKVQSPKRAHKNKQQSHPRHKQDKITIVNRYKRAQEKTFSRIFNNHLIAMSDKLLDAISKASSATKTNISQFLKNLFKNEEREEIAHDENNIMEIFNRNTVDMSITKAREVSKDERSQRLLANHQFNYGEISFHTMYLLFQKIKSLRKFKENQIFYDLGSGTGKVVFAAALCYPFLKCVGIEFLESLYKFSKSLQTKLQLQRENIQSQIKNWRQEFRFPKIEFLNGDFKETDWTDGTIIFVSSTCYSKEVMNQIEKLCSKLERGTIIVTLTRKLQNAYGIPLKMSFEGETSWGTSTIFVHMKQI